MNLTSFNLDPLRPELLDDAPSTHRSRRFSDPVSPLNDGIHDDTRLLAAAVELVDSLGLEIVSVEANRWRNKRIHVAHSRACAVLEGVETQRTAKFSHWTADRFGVEIVWAIPMEAA